MNLWCAALAALRLSAVALAVTLAGTAPAPASPVATAVPAAARTTPAPDPALPFPCDTTSVDLQPDSEPVDASLAFQRGVLQLVTQQLVGVAEERAAAVLHLDEVNLHDAGGKGRVRLRKEFGSRLQVSYVAPVGHASEQRLRLELRIHPGLAFQSESDQQGRTGSDLTLRLPWR